VVCIATGYLVALILRLPSPSMGSFVQASFRGNLAYVGLPIVLYSLASVQGEGVGRLESIAVLAFAPMVPTYNLLSILILSAHGRKETGARWHELISQVLTNPLIIAAAVGFVLMATHTPLPDAADRALCALGNVALPLMLLAIGASLSRERVQGRMLHSVSAALIKCVAAPLVGVLLARYIGLDTNQTAIALIYLACPTAVVSYVMAEQLGADEVLAGSTVVVSTLFSFVPLAVVVAWTVH
jgi:predicted permease